MNSEQGSGILSGTNHYHCNCDLLTLSEINRKLLSCKNLLNCYTQILEALGQVTGSCRVYIAKLHSYSAQALCHHYVAEWRAAGIPSTSASTQAPPVPLAWGKRLLQDGILLHPFATLPIEPPIRSPQSVQIEPEHQSNLSLLLPLLVEDELWGAIGFEHEGEVPSWNPLETSLLQETAAILSVKLEQLQTQAELQQQVQHLTHSLEQLAQKQTAQLQKALDFEALLKRITDRVRDNLDEDHILQTVVRELAKGLEVLSCDTGIYDLEQSITTISHEYLRSSTIPAAKNKTVLMENHTEIYSQLLQGEDLQFCWLSAPSQPARDLKENHVILACPIIDDQGVIGDLWLYDAADVYFDIEEVKLVQQVANQCAIAIRQARLYKEAQTQVRELERLNYLKDDFLNTVSHELRSPLANMEMAIQMLELILFKDELNDEPEARQCDIEETAFQKAARYFRMLQDECQRETSLINDLLDLSRLEAGTEPLMLTAIDLSTWIAHVVEPFLNRIQRQQQQLHMNIPTHLPLLTTDLASLERILSELVHNACKYTPAGGNIILKVRQEPALNSRVPLLYAQPSESPSAPALLLQVINSGIEIPPVELPHIFDKFYRVPSNDPWKHGGTGLGLALVKKLVEHLGATIQVESAAGQVIFTIRFPLEATSRIEA